MTLRPPEILFCHGTRWIDDGCRQPRTCRYTQAIDIWTLGLLALGARMGGLKHITACASQWDAAQDMFNLIGKPPQVLMTSLGWSCPPVPAPGIRGLREPERSRYPAAKAMLAYDPSLRPTASHLAGLS